MLGMSPLFLGHSSSDFPGLGLFSLFGFPSVSFLFPQTVHFVFWVDPGHSFEGWVIFTLGCYNHTVHDTLGCYNVTVHVILWMGEIHFEPRNETMVEAIGIYRGVESIQIFLGGSKWISQPCIV